MAHLGGERRDAGPREVGQAAAALLPAPWKRRGVCAGGGCARVGRAEGAGAGRPSRGARGETKLRATSRGRVSPLSVGQKQRWRKCGKPEEPMGRGKWGCCQVLWPSQSLFSAFLCPLLSLSKLAGELQIASLPSPPHRHSGSPVRPPPPSLPTFHPLLFG